MKRLTRNTLLASCTAVIISACGISQLDPIVGPKTEKKSSAPSNGNGPADAPANSAPGGNPGSPGGATGQCTSVLRDPLYNLLNVKRAGATGEIITLLNGRQISKIAFSQAADNGISDAEFSRWCIAVTHPIHSAITTIVSNIKRLNNVTTRTTSLGDIQTNCVTWTENFSQALKVLEMTGVKKVCVGISGQYEGLRIHYSNETTNSNGTTTIGDEIASITPL
jgi:hypothetical protein